MNQSENSLQQSFNHLASDYDSKTNTFHHKISEYLTQENLLLEIPSRKNIRILDSGGGTGKFSLFLYRLGYSVELSDISIESIKVAVEKLKAEGYELPTTSCNSESTPFPDQSFDFVMMNGGVISHTPDPEELLNETFRILKPQGLLWFDFLNSVGWAAETNAMEEKVAIAKSENRLIQMPDWDYPARIMSLGYVEQLLQKTGFRLKSKYGLVQLSLSLPLEVRYSTPPSSDLVRKYQEAELELSRKQDCIGTSWSCSFCAIKE